MQGKYLANQQPDALFSLTLKNKALGLNQDALDERDTYVKLDWTS